MLDVIFSWTTLWWLILSLYIPACIGLIVIVLLQKGKGVGFAGAFGGSAGGEAIFGPRSSKSLPQKITYVAAGVFMTLALVMSMISGKVGRSAAPELIPEKPKSDMQGLFQENAGQPAAVTEGEAQPAAPAESAAPVVAPTPQQVTTESGQKVNVISIDPATGKQVDVSAPAPAAAASEAAPAPAPVAAEPAAAPAVAPEAAPAPAAPEAAPAAAPVAAETHTESAPETPAQ